MTGCNARFAGRRKPGGGYSYYDFMQGRSFDIAGPNPTAEERKQIDHEYIQFLDAQGRETVSAELAKRHNEQLQADLERERQSVGPPLVLTPKNPSTPAARKPAERSKPARCEDNSLACGWSKLSAGGKGCIRIVVQDETVIWRRLDFVTSKGPGPWLHVPLQPGGGNERPKKNPLYGG